MSIKQISAIICIFLSIKLSAQSKLTGHIVDGKNKNKIEDASVSQLRNNKSIIKYTFTDKTGAFHTTLSKEAKYISVTHLGYKPLIVSLEEVKANDTYQLKPTDYKIKEVKVVWNRIKENKDTLTYSVRGFRMKQDRTIADVIKKMPGLEVLPSGIIKFEDKAINKLYIEGMDLMGSRYSMATNNLSGKIVKEVQVLREHQPIAALQGKVFSEQAAINLILEDDVKYNFNGAFDAGSGYSEDNDLLWSIRFLGMILGRKNQNLSLYKTNNMGDDVRDEISIKTYNREFQPGSDIALIDEPSIKISNVDKNRYLDNRSHLFATNHLYKINATSTIRGQLSFLHQNKKGARESGTTYFYPDKTIVIDENNRLSTQTNEWNLDCNYERNDEDCYIKNKLVTKIKDYKGSQHLISNKSPIHSKQNVDPKEITNFFKYIKTLKNGHILKLFSTIAYRETPQTLSVTPGLYCELLNKDKPFEKFTQQVHLRSFVSKITTEEQVKIAGFYAHLKGGVDYQQQQLTSQLYCSMNGTSYPTPQKGFENDTKWQDTKIFITPSLTYRDETWKLKLNLPLSYHNYRLSYNEKPQKRNSYHKLFAEPQLYISVNINGYWDINTNVNLYYQTPNINHLYAHYIFQNYREAYSGNGFYTSHILASGITLKYSNPINGIFWTTGATITPKWQDKILESRTEDILSSHNLIDYKHQNLSWRTHTRFSKSFGWHRLITALSARYYKNRTKLLLNKEITPYISKGVQVALDLSIQPYKFLTIEGSQDYVYSTLSSRLTNNRYSASMRSYLYLNFFPSEHWKIKWNHLYINQRQPISSSVYFMDAGISFLTKRIEFEVSVNNIFNKSSLTQTRYYSMSEQTTCSYFRPREIMAKIYLVF